MKTTYLKPVLDLAATGTKIKTLMMQKEVTPRQLQVIMDFPYVQMDDIVVTRMVEMVIDASGVPEARLQYLKGSPLKNLIVFFQKTKIR